MSGEYLGDPELGTASNIAPVTTRTSDRSPTNQTDSSFDLQRSTGALDFVRRAPARGRRRARRSSCLTHRMGVGLKELTKIADEVDDPACDVVVHSFIEDVVPLALEDLDIRVGQPTCPGTSVVDRA
jgi:hypothetical protein